MKFYWADPLDLIDPSFNFITEKGRYGLAKQQHQQFPHEVYSVPLYQGFMISKINVDKGFKSRWNAAQMSRFFRQGAKRFLRFPSHLSLEVIGDSGAYSRTGLDQLSSKSIDECLEVIDFYNAIDVDYGLSPDNVISGHRIDGQSKHSKKIIEDWSNRWKRTLDLADTFWKFSNRKGVRWKPLGVAQGWDSASYQKSVEQLQQIGYNIIAIGGLNRLEEHEILQCVKACYQSKNANTTFHLLGVCRIELIAELEKLGVSSFDSAMPIRQAISDDRHNYHTTHSNYLAIRVPQTYASPKLIRMVSQERLNHQKLRTIEETSIEVLRKYDKDEASLNEVMDILTEGIDYRNEHDYSHEYRRVLEDMPWKSCPCKLCHEIGIEIILLRNRERNLRRGFHNLFVLSQKMQQQFITL